MSYFADDLSMNTNFLQELLLSVFRKTRKLVKKSSIFKIKRFGIQELSESMMSQKGESSGIMMAKEIIDTYQLLDPTICAVLRAQEVVFAYVAQAVVLHVIPYYLSFIGASFVILSAICTPLEKYVRPKLPERLRLIC